MTLPRFLSVLFVIFILFGATPLHAQVGAQKTERIEAELVPMGQWAVPGSTAIIAIRQKIQPGWHTYWRNPGDSGGPTEAHWTLPQGYKAGDIVWPLPERQRLQTLMNYGYSGVVYLPVPIEVPASAKAGESVLVSAKVLFMVCSDEMCVPDEMELAVNLPVAEGTPPLTAAHGAAIQKVLETAPRPAEITARAHLEEGVLKLSASGGALAGMNPKWAYFFAFESGQVDHAALQQGQRGENGISLNIVAGRGLKAKGLGEGISGVLATDLGAWEITATEGDMLPATSGLGALDSGENMSSKDAPASSGFLKAALFALLGGLILNLMPCVFPVLAMKAAALGRSAHDPREARKDGLGFLAGVLVTFGALASLLLALRAGGQAVGWGFQLQSPAVTAALSLLMLAVGLNMSGLFHIGGRLQGVGSGLAQGKGGVVGAFFTGVLAVVVAAPCTAPFMALALGAALVMPWPMALIVFVMLGLGLALPYVLVSFSPRILSRLPKPGSWMETFRNLLAFPMYGAALWLAWVFARQTGEALGLLFVAGLLLAFTLWLWGRYQSGGRRLMLAVAIFAAVLTVPAIFLAMKAPPVASAVVNEEGKALASQSWSSAAVETALAEGRPVLVNFTADWCVTCKINERTALATAGTAKALAGANAVYLVGDWTNRDDAITRELERHGRSGVPLYLLYTPGVAEPRILPQLLTEGLVGKALSEATKQD
ncbi:protein-disulfide reductase DsbD domain-containing protein [Brevundimonas sp. BH3]|uniref:protein-disulfide reductase DsbD family protein n=1 Tax=Brevundimonas sp. BH3 TaxID=3133089 RepID=UPI00324A5813